MVLSAEQALDSAIILANAISDLHANRITHRDIKSANIMLDKDMKPKLGDFGTSKLLQTLLGASTVVGSFNYMAPEIIDGLNGDPSPSDVYRLFDFYEVLSKRKMPPAKDKPEGMSKEARKMWWYLVEDCTLQSPGARPLMSVVASRLKTICDVVHGVLSIDVVGKEMEKRKEEKKKREEEKRKEEDARKKEHRKESLEKAEKKLEETKEKVKEIMDKVEGKIKEKIDEIKEMHPPKEIPKASSSKIDIGIILEDKHRADYTVQVPSLDISVKELRDIITNDGDIDFEYKFILTTAQSPLGEKQEDKRKVDCIYDKEKKRITIRKKKSEAQSLQGAAVVN